jgi:polyhydroxyalkanoate synthase subunit PhaC
MTIHPTPRDTLFQDGTASLYRFRNATPLADDAPVVLLVPSLINRWYVLDLHEEASLAKSLAEAGFRTYCLDWGIPRDEDRYLSWEDLIARIHRMMRKVKRDSGAERVGLLGYCMGATLSGIYTALHPEEVACFVNLAGPFDFSAAGVLGELTEKQWFDVEAIAAAGNVHPMQMQTGFLSLRPTSQISKWVALADRAHDEAYRKAFDALDTWADDNIPFPAAAYVTYIRELYQENRLVKGEHYVAGRHVDLGNITCPVLTIATDRDHICPEPAARSLYELCGASDKEHFVVPGGHVGAVVGSKAKVKLYPKIASWFHERLAPPVVKAVEAAPETDASQPAQTSIVAPETLENSRSTRRKSRSSKDATK